MYTNEKYEMFAAVQRTEVTSPCPVYCFLFQPAQLGVPKRLRYINGSGIVLQSAVGGFL